MKATTWIFLLTYFAVVVAAGSPIESEWKAGQPVLTIEPEKNPFWRRKEKVLSKIKNDRAIVVSVKSQPTKVAEAKAELYMQGAGWVNAPLTDVYAVARKFEDYPKISDYVVSANFDPATGYLRMHTRAFGYEAHLKMQMEFREFDATSREIRFRVVEGVFKNLNGVVRMEQISPKTAEISLTALQGYRELPIPKFFVEFGLEFALQRMAGKMRSFVESKRGSNDIQSKTI